MKDIIVLGIESSCDETAVAIVKNRKEILSSVVATQIDVHKEFGGVIPEVASRIHVENISMVIEEALKQADLSVADVDAIAVTQGPGLIGCLHVGVHAAKTLAWCRCIISPGISSPTRSSPICISHCLRWSFPADIPSWSI